MTFLLCLATLVLCFWGACTGIKVIKDFQEHWKFNLINLWRGEDAALTYGTVATSTGACIGLGVMLGLWLFTQSHLSGLENAVWAMNHFAAASAIVGFHHLASRFLRRSIRDRRAK